MAIRSIFKNKHRRAGNRRAMSILVALIIVSILLMLASAGLKISSDESEVTSYDLYGMQAFCAAESGIMHASTKLAGDSSFRGKITGTIEVSVDAAAGGGESSAYDRELSFYEAEVSASEESGTGAIQSTGSYMGVKRKLRAEIDTISPLRMKKAKELFD